MVNRKWAETARIILCEPQIMQTRSLFNSPRDCFSIRSSFVTKIRGKAHRNFLSVEFAESFNDLDRAVLWAFLTMANKERQETDLLLPLDFELKFDLKALQVLVPREISRSIDSVHNSLQKFAMTRVKLDCWYNPMSQDVRARDLKFIESYTESDNGFTVILSKHLIRSVNAKYLMPLSRQVRDELELGISIRVYE